MRSNARLLSVLLVAGCGGAAHAGDPAAAEPSTGADAPIQITMDVPPADDAAPSAPAPAAAEPAGAATAVPADPVWLNGVQLTAPDLRELEAVLGRAPVPGRYWYDPHSGLWGLEGHGAGGVTRPGMRVPAPLPADASHGKSGVFVNDRELTVNELSVLAKLLAWPPPARGELSGRYVLDDRGGFYSIQGRYLGSVATSAPQALANSTSPAPCAWLHLGGTPDVLGRDVTINCD
jgi:hypothetical protein